MQIYLCDRCKKELTEAEQKKAKIRSENTSPKVEVTSWTVDAAEGEKQKGDFCHACTLLAVVEAYNATASRKFRLVRPRSKKKTHKENG